MREWINIVTEVSDPKSKYRYGYCSSMAIALHRLTGKPLGIFRGFFPDDFGEEGDEAYEDAHAVLFLGNNRWADVDGIHVGVPPNLHFNEPVELVEIVPSSEREVHEAFSTEEMDEADIKNAQEFALSDPKLSSLIKEWQ